MVVQSSLDVNVNYVIVVASFPCHHKRARSTFVTLLLESYMPQKLAPIKLAVKSNQKLQIYLSGLWLY